MVCWEMDMAAIKGKVTAVGSAVSTGKVTKGSARKGKVTEGAARKGKATADSPIKIVASS